MPNSTPTPRDEFANHCAELLGSAGPVRIRRMFGGHGLYVDGIFIAIVSAERLCLKADDLTRARFEAAGGQPFVYEAKGNRQISISYFTAPDDAMESPTLMQPWARLALEAALRARVPKPRAPARKTRSAPSAPAAKPRKSSATKKDAKP
jgi:DNA transformation protein